VPGPFDYWMALFTYVCFGVVVLAVAVVLALIPRTRPLARSIAGGIIGSYPGVFVFQLATIPVIGCVGILISMLSSFDSHMASRIALALVAFIIILALSTSLAGFFTGWSVGAAVARGTPVFDAIALTWAGRLLRRLWPVELH
jgi:hypothetical protein